MIDQWLNGVADLIANAPGGVSPAWDSTADRTGEADAAGVLTNRIWFDFFEAADVEPERPFFVLTAEEVDWQLDRAVDAQYLQAAGVVEVAYTERVTNQDDADAAVVTNAQHRAALLDFAGWVGNLMQYCAESHLSAAVQLVGLQQLTTPQRTPKKRREAGRLDSDYFWTSWAFIIGRDRFAGGR